VRRRIAVALFFAALLGLGLANVRDYGISWDEPRQREIGGASARYAAETLAPSLVDSTLRSFPELATFVDRDYGVAFEMPAFVLEWLLGISDTRDSFMLRHLLTFLLFVGGVFAVYRLAERRFADWRVGLLAALCLVLSPRIFADAFYNSKDLVFLSAFAIATNTLVAFVTRPGPRSALWHGVATAVAIDIRVMAIVLFAGAFVALAVRAAKREIALTHAAGALLVYVTLTVPLVIVLFPFLWSAPYRHFLEAFENMSHFRGQGEVRYLGEYVMSSALPWHYLPVWMAVTTPPVYLVLCVIGLGAILARLVRANYRLWRDEDEMQDLLFVALLSAPVLAVVWLNSVLYDGWRHLYFVYPMLVLVAIRGWLTVWRAAANRGPMRVALAAVFAVSLAATASWMVRAHPVQNVYFNLLAGRDWHRRFELDYWGLGNRKALEYILAHDPNPEVNVRAMSWTPLDHTVMMLRPKERRRVRLWRDVKAESYPLYVLTNYRKVTDFDEPARRGWELFYELKIDGEVILSVYKVTSA
jgi:hypothetical protein